SRGTGPGTPARPGAPPEPPLPQPPCRTSSRGCRAPRVTSITTSRPAPRHRRRVTSGWWRGVGRDVVIEVTRGALHPLDEVRQGGFWIGASGVPPERAVVPVPILLELAELETCPGEGGKHGSMAGGVVHDEGLSAAAPLQL